MSAIKKISLQEKRKLERRLPLWESAYKVADSKDRKMLQKKIEDARKLLNLLPSPLFTSVGKPKKKTEIITERAPKLEKRLIDTGEPYVVNTEGKQIFLDEILFMKNKLKMKDIEIWTKHKINNTMYQRFKNKNIKIEYVCKSEKKITPSIYCNIKNETQMSDYKICKLYGIKNPQNFSYWRKELIKIEWHPRKELEYGTDLYFEAAQYAKVLNSKEYDIDEIREKLGLSKFDMKQMIKKILYEKYCIKNPLKITPEIYCYEKNVLGLTDTEINKKYKNKYKNEVHWMKKKHIEIKFVKKY